MRPPKARSCICWRKSYAKTVLMVTHRLRGTARFNQIIVMDNGQIIEQGSHAELLAKQGRYFQFKQRL